MASPPQRLTTLLARLAASAAEFLLVGGLAAVAQGAPLATVNVGFVHRRAEANVDRLLAFLAGIGARYRGRAGGQAIPPTRDALLGPGHHLLATALGPLDLLGAIEGGGYGWPSGFGNVPASIGGEVNRDVSASDPTWEFFQRRARTCPRRPGDRWCQAEAVFFSATYAVHPQRPRHS